MSATLDRVVNSAVGRWGIRAASKFVSRPPLILFYHGVSAPSMPANGGIRLRNVSEKHLPLDAFASHLRTLSQTRRVIPLAEMVESLRAGESLAGTVAITFDDGYENNFLQAAPALADFKMPATFFLSTGFIGTDTWIWTDRLEMMLDETKVEVLTFELTGQSFSLRGTPEKRAALAAVKGVLKRLPNIERLNVMHELERALRLSEVPPPDGDYRFMNWDQARRLADAGFDIGGHSISHPILSKLPLEEAKQEILGSCEKISAEIGKCSASFCYPNGKVSDYTQELKRYCEKHFRSAVSTNHGVAHADELYELKRLGPPTGARKANIEWLLFRAK